ncbi:hypothetical protein [Flavobacterium sp. CAU 1735]|uniref:hypothetical protein n=1 Tax=Flavobacterium sp. CAU 1735 TaxID=3140361 RepID=UPI003260E784
MIKKIAVLLLLSSIFFCSCSKFDPQTATEVIQNYYSEGKLNGAVLIVQNIGILLLEQKKLLAYDDPVKRYLNDRFITFWKK